MDPVNSTDAYLSFPLSLISNVKKDRVKVRRPYSST